MRRLWWGLTFLVLVVATIGVVMQRHQKEPAPLRQGFGGVKWGEHFIVGYTDPEEMKILIKAGVGGVFVTQRNAKGKTLNALREEIQTFLDIRPDLFIATDFEGGVVQKLSPPLSRFPAIGEITDVATYAASQAAELRSVGVNVNFSPVVDLDPGKIYKGDRYTKISKRAISDDPKKVTEVASEYIDGMKAGGIMPTLKHFPGLRLAEGDTHLKPVVMNVGMDELRSKDWVPFRNLLDKDIWLMLSHVQVPGLEAMKVIREEWKFDGVVVSDDWSMGGAGSAMGALNSGVDIILVAFDPEVYYQVMKEMLVADQKGEIDRDKLRESEQRIDRVRGIVDGHVAQ